MATNRYKKKNMPTELFIFSLVLLCLAGYYVSGLFKLEGASLSNVGASLEYILSHPFYNWANETTPACLGLALFAWLAFISYYLTYNRNFQANSEHGSEDWGDPVKISRELLRGKAQDTRILSRHLEVPLEGGLSNNNMLVVGASGAYKTTGLMHPNLLKFQSTYVVLDVKGDTQRKLGKTFVEHGYHVGSLNLKNPRKSDRYNPFIYIETEDDLLRAAKALQDSARPPKDMSSADPFWDDGVRLFLQALFYYVWLDAREQGKVGTMNDLIYAANAENQPVDDSTTLLQQMMNAKEAQYGPSYPPVRDYRKLKMGAPDTVKSIVIMINAMLAPCETAEVRRIFSGNDIDIRELGAGVGGDPEKKTILFLCIPDNNNAYNFVVSLFYTQMFDILIRLSDDELKAPLPCRVEVWMDEFYAGAKPANPDVLLGVVRSRNIAMIPMLQSFAQIKTLYPNAKWETLMDNIAAVAYLGSGPMAHESHKFVSEVLGKATIDTKSDGIRRGAHGDASLNFQRGGRELMTPAEIRRMPSTECIIFLEGRPAVYDQKSIPFDDPNKNYRADEKEKERYSEALGLGPYDHPVEVIYDPKNFYYYTLEQEKVLSFPDEKEVEKLRKAALADPHIRVYDISEKELLYLNFGKETKTQEEIAEMLQEAIDKERRQKEFAEANLIVMQELKQKNGNREREAEAKGSQPQEGWIRYGTLGECLNAYFAELTPIGQELIGQAVDEGLPEDFIKNLIYLPEAQMQKAYIQYKQQLG